MFLGRSTSNVLIFKAGVLNLLLMYVYMYTPYLSLVGDLWVYLSCYSWNRICIKLYPAHLMLIRQTPFFKLDEWQNTTIHQHMQSVLAAFQM